MTTPTRRDAVNESLNAVQAGTKRTQPQTNPAPARDPLPMGWTKVKRRRRSKKQPNGDVIEWCCDDPSCPRESLSLNRTDSIKSERNLEVYKGQGIVCLHDFDASWFQGYFLPNESRKPWGLLLVEEALDECLECADGGYRRVSITAYPHSNKKKQCWKGVEWTGGDMVKLCGENLLMETQRFWTGPKAVPYVEKYFENILEKARGGDADPHQSVLEVLPNIAIAIGPMTISLRQSEQDDDTTSGSS